MWLCVNATIISRCMVCPCAFSLAPLLAVWGECKLARYMYRRRLLVIEWQLESQIQISFSHVDFRMPNFRASECVVAVDCISVIIDFRPFIGYRWCQPGIPAILVHIPQQQNVYRRIMPKAERLSNKWTVGWEVKLQGKMCNFEDNLSAEGIILQLYQKGIYNPLNNFSRETHVAPSCIFCGFFCVSLCGK